ncbi:MAG: hypothetical protein GWN00_00225, partial [Aliifodinibius sp.]|nr:hypothetical protein [Fodinibius sp.]NIY23291.1 hypothetical protein [Fodinibius sp.]
MLLFFIFAFIFLTVTDAAATDYWDKQQREHFARQKPFLNITKISQSDFFLFKKRIEAPEGFYPYPAEMTEMAQFLSQWQVLDPTSPDYGGMIEAESGQLGDVIQTDNTQEAIVVWCQYTAFTGDSITHRQNIDAAWDYIMNFPAYDEEGDPGDDYYRDHNCAWALWGEQWFRWVYSDTTYKWYADSCAQYMMEHRLFLATTAPSLNAFVTGWMAGNLYWYGEQNSSQAYMDSAL